MYCAVALTLPAAYQVSGDMCVLWGPLLLTCPSPVGVTERRGLWKVTSAQAAGLTQHVVLEIDGDILKVCV